MVEFGKSIIPSYEHTSALCRKIPVVVYNRSKNSLHAALRVLKKLNTFLRKPKFVNVTVDDLIFPDRLDIWLRVLFLQVYDNNFSNLELSKTSYYIFRVDLARTYDWAPSAEESVRRFIEVYESVKSKEYVRGNNRNDYIKVVNVDGGSEVRAYALFDGAHRLAIVKHLGYKTVDCLVGTEPFDFPDYTSRILAGDYAGSVEMKHAISDWHRNIARWRKT